MQTNSGAKASKFQPGNYFVLHNWPPVVVRLAEETVLAPLFRESWKASEKCSCYVMLLTFGRYDCPSEKSGRWPGSTAVNGNQLQWTTHQQV